MSAILILVLIYLLVGWIDCAVAYRQMFGHYTWKWIALGWPIRWIRLARRATGSTEGP